MAIVSCDIVGHSSVRDRDEQIRRVNTINVIVADLLASCGPDDVVWASGGDGGHVVFRQPEWREPALAFMTSLRRWSRHDDISIRITGHHGKATHISGADGRVQVVGHAINFAGWLLTRGSDAGIVVSESFRDCATSAPGATDVRFHDLRVLRHKDLPDQRLYLASIGDDRSKWAVPVQADRCLLRDAATRGQGWDVLYHAKRIFQANTRDEQAASALHELHSHHLQYRDTNTSTQVMNPFLGHLEPHMLREVVQLGQLVERRYNDVICRYGDAGDTMFVILRGQVGVYKSEGEGSAKPEEPAFIHQEGEIVGELAFALSRNRTADLIALSDVALLSFNSQELLAALSKIPASELTLRQVSRFINYRVLEHASHNAPYLLGHDRTGPLAVGKVSWQETLTLLGAHCRLGSIEENWLHLDFGDLTPEKGWPTRAGVHILAAGELRVDGEEAPALRGEEFPLLWVNVPGLLDLHRRSFSIETEPVKILYLDGAGIARLEPRKRKALSEALRQAIAKPPRTNVDRDDQTKHGRTAKEDCEFDAFLCHSSADDDVVLRVAQRLRSAGVTYWLDAEQIHFGDAITAKIEDGLRNSRYLIPCVSAHLTRSNWARTEYGAILHAEITGRPDSSVIPLMLDDSHAEMPLLLRDKRRVSYANDAEFTSFINHLSSRKGG